MNRRLARFLTRFYPAAWRARYGAELTHDEARWALFAAMTSFLFLDDVRPGGFGDFGRAPGHKE